jgi:hypothetical protein
MIGYHYTSYKNFLKIRKRGLVPQELPLHIKHHLVDRKINITIGSWVWLRKPTGRNHLGNLIRVLAKHNTDKVCVLRVEFPDEDVCQHEGDKVLLKHDANIDDFVYHKNCPAYLVMKPIPPEKIQLLDAYDLTCLVNNRG